VSSTFALYVRIPAELHERLEAYLNESTSWRRKGSKQTAVIGALNSFLPPLPVKAKAPKSTKKGRAK
jgi:hypothetical protein